MQSEHFAWFLGIVPNITIMNGPSGSRSPDASFRSSENVENSNSEDSNRDWDVVRPSEIQLIDRIETAQLENRLPYAPDPIDRSDPNRSNCVFAHLQMTKHGLKISDANTKVKLIH